MARKSQKSLLLEEIEGLKLQVKAKELEQVMKNMPPPNIREVAFHLVALNGGAQGLALLVSNMLAESKNLPPMARANIIRMALDILKHVSPRDGEGEDLGYLSEKDLEAEIAKIVKKAKKEEKDAEVPQEACGG
jgi:hypothetical protein